MLDAASLATRAARAAGLGAVVELPGLTINTNTWAWDGSVFGTTESIVFHVLMIVLYEVLVVLCKWHVGRSMAKNNGVYVKPAGFHFFRQAHNLLHCTASIWMTYTIVTEVLWSGEVSAAGDLMCKVQERKGLYGLAMLVFALLKPLEWFDTFFLIMSGKRVIFLHNFHHATTFSVALSIGGMPAGRTACLNAFVHIFMYAHYYKSMPAIRQFLTTGQIMQFLIMIAFHLPPLYSYWTGTPACYDPSTGVLWDAYWALFVVTVFLVLFIRFSIKAYILPPPKRTEKKRA